MELLRKILNVKVELKIKVDYVIIIEKINKMSKIIEKNVAELIVVGVFLMIFLSSCGTFSKMTEKEKELNYQIDKAYFEYSFKRDSLILEYYKPITK
jgi:hypothetical protein